MYKKIIFVIIGAGVFAIVIAPFVHLLGVMYFGFLSITPELSPNDNLALESDYFV